MLPIARTAADYTIGDLAIQFTGIYVAALAVLLWLDARNTNTSPLRTYPTPDAFMIVDATGYAVIILFVSCWIGAFAL